MVQENLVSLEFYLIEIKLLQLFGQHQMKEIYFLSIGALSLLVEVLPKGEKETMLLLRLLKMSEFYINLKEITDQFWL